MPVSCSKKVVFRVIEVVMHHQQHLHNCVQSCVLQHSAANKAQLQGWSLTWLSTQLLQQHSIA
jgi:hypothetical protein